MAQQAVQQCSIPLKRQKLSFGKLERQKTYVSYKLDNNVTVNLIINDDCEIERASVIDPEDTWVATTFARFKHALIKNHEARRGEILVNELNFTF